MKRIKKKNAYFWILILLFIFNLLSFYPASIAKTNNPSNATGKFQIEITKLKYTYFKNYNVIPSDNYISGKIYSDTPIISFKLYNLDDAKEIDVLPYITKENKTNIYDFKIPISDVQYIPSTLYHTTYNMAILCDNDKNEHIRKKFQLCIYNNLEDLITPSLEKTYLIYYRNPHIIKLDKNNNIIILHSRDNINIFYSASTTVYNNCYVSDIFHRLSKQYPTTAYLPAQYKILLKKASLQNNFLFYINVKALPYLNFLRNYTDNINNINITFSNDAGIDIDKSTNKITLLYKNYKENISQNNIIVNSDGTFISVKLLNNINNKKILILNDDVTPRPITIVTTIFFYTIIAMIIFFETLLNKSI